MRQHILVRVLIIGDDPDIRAVLRPPAAMRAGRRWRRSKAQTCWRCFASVPRPHIALLDYRMPAMDGLQVLWAMAAHPALQRHTHLLITANPMTLPPDLLVLAQRLGIPTLAKPFDLDEVVDAIACAAARTLPLAVVARSPAQVQVLA